MLEEASIWSAFLTPISQNTPYQTTAARVTHPCFPPVSCTLIPPNARPSLAQAQPSSSPFPCETQPPQRPAFSAPSLWSLLVSRPHRSPSYRGFEGLLSKQIQPISARGGGRNADLVPFARRWRSHYPADGHSFLPQRWPTAGVDADIHYAKPKKASISTFSYL